MHPNEPIIARPVIYFLPKQPHWEWCRLGDICTLVPDVARLAGNTYAPLPEQLISDFAALIRLNKHPVGNVGTEQQATKLFRYSLGEELGATEVPCTMKNSVDPPFAPFKLEIALTRDLFVPADWARDTLEAIQRGAIAAVQWRDEIIGYPEDESKHHIHLGPVKINTGK